jgi:hypothetical protein
MGMLVLGLISWAVVRRTIPNASSWVGAKVNSKVLLVVVLVVYLATGLASLNLHSTNAIVPTTWMIATVTDCQTSNNPYQEFKRSAFIPAALTPRAPPVF